MNRKCKSLLFTIEERVDLTAQIKAAKLVIQGIEQLKDPNPVLMEWKENKLPRLLQQNPFPRVTPFPEAYAADDYTTMLEEAPELLPESFVVQAGELSFLACKNHEGKIHEESKCGAYPFHTLIAAADYLSGVYDESTVELYHSSRYRTGNIFSENNHDISKGYQKFIFDRTECGYPSVVEGDTLYAVEMTHRLSPRMIAEVVQKHSPLAVFAADYGKRIVKRSRLPIFTSKNNLILR